MQKLETLVARCRGIQGVIATLTYVNDNIHAYEWNQDDLLNILKEEKKNLLALKNQIIKCLDEEIQA